SSCPTTAQAAGRHLRNVPANRYLVLPAAGTVTDQRRILLRRQMPVEPAIGQACDTERMPSGGRGALRTRPPGPLRDGNAVPRQNLDSFAKPRMHEFIHHARHDVPTPAAFEANLDLER